MNILYINNFAGSKEFGMELRPYYLCKNWATAGNKSSIVAASFVHTRHTQPDVKTNLQMDKIDNVDYYWIKTPAYEGIGVARLFCFMLFILRLTFAAKRLARRIKPDFVIASSTYLLDFYPAFLIARFAKAKLVYEIPDIQPLSLIELFGYSHYHPFIYFLSVTEKFIYKYTDKVVCVLPNGFTHMQKYKLPLSRYAMIPNGIDIESWRESNLPLPEDLGKIIETYKSLGFFLVGYAGYISQQNCLDQLIDTAALLQQEKVAFLIVGDGPDKEKMMELNRRKNNVHAVFYGRIPKEAVPAFLSSMDVLFIAFKKLKLYQFGVNTNKLYEYMIQGKPVIQCQNAGNDLVAEGECGISCPAEDPKAAADAVLTLMKMTGEERQLMGERGKLHVIEHYDYKILSEKYLKVIQ
ncbi:MAG: glycosyltransferase family 4 protein [Ignavibacteriaceae bacterium]|jgi:glycosyltransferase involved in cell wall biosynthesis|nr:glycosyltransferase family 4 protein [Ignavibacteriaceae bacterium]